MPFPIQTATGAPTNVDVAAVGTSALPLAAAATPATTMTPAGTPRPKTVVGFDICESSIANARDNAAANGLTTCSYYAGKAEDTLPAFLKTLAAAPAAGADNADVEFTPAVVSVVDPPRAGLHPSVLKSLRRCSRLDALVYVSCNPATLVQDLHKLVSISILGSLYVFFCQITSLFQVGWWVRYDLIAMFMSSRRKRHRTSFLARHLCLKRLSPSTCFLTQTTAKWLCCSNDACKRTADAYRLGKTRINEANKMATRDLSRCNVLICIKQPNILICTR